MTDYIGAYHEPATQEPKRVLVTVGYDGHGSPVRELVPVENVADWDANQWRPLRGAWWE